MAKKIVAFVFFISLAASFYDAGVSAQTLNPVSAGTIPSCASAGTPITITANANRSNGIYFKYRVRDSGQSNWSNLNDNWTTNNSMVWTPTSNGKKEIDVQMTHDPASVVSRPGMVGLSYEVGASNCIDPVAISLNPTNGRVNDPVTITVTGPQVNLYYQFFVTPVDPIFGDGEKVTLTNWIPSNRFVWTPANQNLYRVEVLTASEPGSSRVGEAKISYKVDLPAQTANPPAVSQPLAQPSAIFSDMSTPVFFTVNVADPDADLASVSIDLSSLGGSSSQAMYDDGSSGDVTSGDGIYSIQTTAPVSNGVGQKALLVTATDQAGNTGANFISLSVIHKITGTVQPQETQRYTIVNTIPGQTLTIRFKLITRSRSRILQSEPCTPTLTVRNPDGGVYATEPITTTEDTVTISNAAAGSYTYEVANNCTSAMSYEITTSGGGVGVVAGTVKDAATSRALTGAQVTSDTGGIALTLSGYYVMLNAAGVFTVSAASQSYQVLSKPSTVLNAGETVVVDFSLTPVAANPHTITINSSTPPEVGTPLSIRFEADGNTVPLYYRYWQANGYQTPQYGNWQVLSGWGTGDTLGWSPPAKDHYVIVAYVTTDTNSGGYQQVGLSVETQGNTANPIMISKLETDLTFPQPKGTAVHLNTTASGGAQALSYRYWQKKEPGGVWTIVRDYAPSSSCLWIPDEAGIYIMVVWVTDDASVPEPPIAGMTCTIGE